MKQPGEPDGFARALALHRAGDLSHAGKLYQGVLAADPDHARALHFLGVLHHQDGRSNLAIASIQRALRQAPDYADAWNNLGNVLKETGQLEPALRAYLRVVELAPGHAEAWNNLGVVLRGQGQVEEACKAYSRALSLDPALVAAWRNLGNLHARLHRFDEAIAAYLRVLQLRPDDAAAYDALGRSLYRSGKVQQAIEVYGKWLQADPGHSVARHMLAACSGAVPPLRASDGYVRDTFDGFAGSFDQVLDQLGYRAPALIGDWLERTLAPADASLAVADAGCGTGLCAGFLRPRARLLVGVDLSPGMLAKARARQAYDQLVEAELASWLAGQQEAFDLIVSADTLCYFGALETVMINLGIAMKPGAHLVFTVEQAADHVHDYQLDPSGRYSHAVGYLRGCLTAAGLHLLGAGQVELRRELGRPVDGLLVSARRPRP